MQSQKSIVIVGLMGVGKTRIGRMVAKKMALDFVDCDMEIENAAGCSVSDIFALYGEEAFRDGERKVIRRILEEEKPKIIATGGGAFIQEKTRRLIKRKSISVWLRADLDTLVERTGRTDKRPLLRQGDPQKILQKLMKERDPIYAEADIHIASDNHSASKTMQQMIDAITQYQD